MAKWRAGSKRAYVALPHPNDPNERVTSIYQEGDVFEMPDDMNPSQSWRPMDAAALAICKRIASKHMKKEPEPPEDPDDEKQSRKFQRLLAKYTMEQNAQQTWFGQDTYRPQQEQQPVAMSQMAASAGKSVRVSDQPI